MAELAGVKIEKPRIPRTTIYEVKKPGSNPIGIETDKVISAADSKSAITGNYSEGNITVTGKKEADDEDDDQ